METAALLDQLKEENVGLNMQMTHSILILNLPLHQAEEGHVVEDGTREETEEEVDVGVMNQLSMLTLIMTSKISQMSFLPSLMLLPKP